MKKLFCFFYFLTYLFTYGQAYYIFNHFFRNDFPAGKIKINATQYDVPTEPNDYYDIVGVWKRWVSPDGPQSATAFSSQYVNGAHYFNHWKQNGEYVTSNLTYSFSPILQPGEGYSIEHVANYISTSTVTLITSAYGTLIIDGVPYSGSKSKTITEPNVITVSALNYEHNGISFSFINWSDGSTQAMNRELGPNTNSTYTANFVGRPNNTYRNQHFNPKVVGQPIKVYWNQHPSTSVTKYGVYRKTKLGAEQLVQTFNRTGTSSYVYTFTDQEYVHTNSTNTTNLLRYDVRAYYNPDGTYSDYDFRTLYAEMGGPQRDDIAQDERMQVTENTYEYGISNYPNPYNPTTTISYSIKEQGNVQVTVYDALGRKIASLVNEAKQPGSYNVMFNGSNLTSGIYFYTMQVNDFMETKKMLLTK